MEVSAAATGPPIPEPPVRPSGTGAHSASTAAAAGAPQDSVGNLLQLLAEPQIHDLLHAIDAHRFPHDSVALDSLLQTAGTAVSHHDVPRALAALTEYINRNPEHAAALPATPALIPIQGEVGELLRHMTSDARIGAERLIATASLAVDAAPKHSHGLDGAAVLAVAGRFVESGQLVNYIRAAELSQAVIAFYGGTAPDIALSVARRDLKSGRQKRPVRHPVRELLQAWWQRVPMLVLLLGWFAMGLAGGAIMLMGRVAGMELVSASTVESCVEVWGVGFLALVLLQFWIRSRPGL